MEVVAHPRPRHSVEVHEDAVLRLEGVREGVPKVALRVLQLVVLVLHPRRQGLTLVPFSPQRKHLVWAAALHTSTFQFVVSTFCGLGCVVTSQRRLRLSWEVDASCGFNDQNWLRLR